MTDSGDSGLDEKEVTVVKSATDLQRLKLEKLMKNPEKLAFIPDRPKDKKFSDPAEFVRNVMGSSAGAGSGEFHVYRHIRRREYSRQDFLQDWREKEELDRAYHEKLKENRREVESKAAKKRCKRQRQKERQRVKRQKLKEMKKKGIPIEKSSSSSSSSSSESSEEDEENGVVKEQRKSEPKDTEMTHQDTKESLEAGENDTAVEEQDKRIEDCDTNNDKDAVKLLGANDKEGKIDDKNQAQDKQTEKSDKIKEGE